MDDTDVRSAPGGSRALLRGWTAGRVAVAVVLGLMVLRVAVLLLAFVNLGPDEAQYWAWAQHLAFGYFSKPPMVAWLIAGTTSICGDGEACVRLSAPLLHAATALVIFALGRHLYGPRIGAWAAIAFSTLPAVFLSAGLITTDVPLVLAWACALYAYRRMIDHSHDGQDDDALKWAALAGVAVGFGLLSKYAMIYFFLCAIIHAALSRTARRALWRSPLGLTIAGIALIIVSPNLIWNAREGFATFKHTAANANWQGQLFHLDKLGDFLGAQFGVMGPILMIVYLIGLMTLTRRMKTATPGADQFLAIFSAPILLIACGQAFISRANANWAGPAYVAATILTIAWLVRNGDRLWFKIGPLKSRLKFLLVLSFAIHIVSGGLLYAFITIPGAIETFAVENTFKRLRGWDTLAAEVARVSREAPYKAVMTDHRLVTAELLYYGRKNAVPVVVFDRDDIPGNEFELKAPYRREVGGPVLYVTFFGDTKPVLSHFESVEAIETFRMMRGKTLFLDFAFYRVDGYRG